MITISVMQGLTTVTICKACEELIKINFKRGIYLFYQREMRITNRIANRIANCLDKFYLEISYSLIYEYVFNDSILFEVY